MKEETPSQKMIIELFGDSRKEQKKIMKQIILEFRLDFIEFKNFYDLRDYTEASEVVHRLNHKIGMLGLEKNYTLAQHFESELRQDNTIRYDNYMKILSTVSQYLDDYEKYNY